MAPKIGWPTTWRSGHGDSLRKEFPSSHSSTQDRRRKKTGDALQHVFIRATGKMWDLLKISQTCNMWDPMGSPFRHGFQDQKLMVIHDLACPSCIPKSGRALAWAASKAANFSTLNLWMSFGVTVSAKFGFNQQN